jgi:hypothetical protein
MDDAVRVRTAARDALEGIDPPRLRAVLHEQLDTASMAPGVLVVLSATLQEPTGRAEALEQRAAGVQLIYEGLRLTRSLAHHPPWETDDGEAPAADIDGDLDVLAADVFVSRGFYLLARTEAATAAVETVRSFGREQTRRLQAEAPGGEAPRVDDGAADSDETLEATVFALAVRAGRTAVGSEPSAELLSYAAAAGRRHDDPLPPAAAALADPLRQRLSELSATAGSSVASSVGDP